MSRQAVIDIQRSLNAIRGELEQASVETKLEATRLMLSASEHVIALALKLNSNQKQSKKPKQKKRRLKVSSKLTKPKAPLKINNPNDVVGTIPPKKPS